MPLHPQSRAVLEFLAAMGGKPLEQTTPEEARAERAKNAEGMATLARPLEQVARIQQVTMPGPGRPVPVRVYWPETGSRLPALIYFHGGGWVLGNLETGERNCRALANASQCVVFNVDYRLAPEHKFPAAVEDAYAAVEYVAQHAQEFGIDPARIAVAGESSGGNLATVACLMAKERGGPRIVFQLLVYPVTNYEDDSPSMQEFAEGHVLTRNAMSYFWRHYVSAPEEARQAYASPLNAKDLAGLPPAMVITAECDILRDQGESYARRLQQAGVPVTLKRYAGAIHIFLNFAGAIDSGKEALADAAAALRTALAAQTPAHFA